MEIAILILLLGLAGAGVYAWLQKRRGDRLKAENELLQPYRKVRNARQEANRIVGEAKQEAERLKQAGTDALAAHRRDGERFGLEIQRRLSDAQARARYIVDEARRKANEIAAEALVALSEYKVNEARLRAIRNLIDGYGSDYLVPPRSVLDDMGDEFDHQKAGQELKEIKARVREMTKQGSGASCDYVQDRRKDTAIAFVLDAFNGKVEAILSRVRTENVGKLRAQIKDAFLLVNANGVAFRNARISDDYLSLRVRELDMAAAVVELKRQDDEEQRRIRERIREEEKAQRDYDRALKDAAKDEDSARKALEKARAELASSGAAERAKFEARMRDLEERLRVAEEKNKRALSMAQQTRAGHIYVISNIGSFGEDVYKIGMTRRLEPLDRVRELGDASVPFEFDVHAMIYSDDAPLLERRLHKQFALSQVNKGNQRKEFFRTPLTQIRLALEQMGNSEIHWTLAAEARQFRETQALERRFAEDTAERDAWLNRQRKLEDVTIDVEDRAAA